MTTLTDYLDSILNSVADIKQRIEMQEDEFNESKVLTAEAAKMDKAMGDFRDMFFAQPEEE